MINSQTNQGSIYIETSNGVLFNTCVYTDISQMFGNAYAKMIAQVDLVNGVIQMNLTEDTISKFTIDSNEENRINSKLKDLTDTINDGSIDLNDNHLTWDFYESDDCLHDLATVTDVEFTASKIIQQNNVMGTALGIHNQKGASQNLQNNLGGLSKIDEILGNANVEQKTEERDDAIDKVRDVANTGLKMGKSSKSDLVEVILRLFQLDDLVDCIPGTRIVIVERKKAKSRVGSNEFYVVEEIIENTPEYITLSNCDDELAPRKYTYSDMRQDSLNGTAMIKKLDNDVAEVGDLLDIHLLTVKQKPINKLMSLFEEDEKEEVIEVNDSHLSKLDSLFDSLEDSTEEIEEESVETKVEAENNSDNINKIDELLYSIEEEKSKDVKEVESPKLSYAAQMIAESMGNMNADKIAELKQRIEDKQRDVSKHEYEAKLSTQRAKQAEADLDVLYSRLGQMEPKKDANGYGFVVGQVNNENASMEVIIATAADSYTQDDFKNTTLSEDVKKELTDLGLELVSVGLGESTWKHPGIDAETIEQIKAGARISLKGKYKAYHELKLDLTKSGFVHDGNLENHINKKKDELCGTNDMDNEARQSLELFDTLNEVITV